MKALGFSFHTKVASRMTTVFVVCAGLPLAALATITVTRTWNELSRRAVQQLRYESRTVTQEALGRLDRMATGLTALTTALAGSSGAVPHVDIGDYLPHAPGAVSVRMPSGAVAQLVGNLELPELSSEDRRHLDDWGRLIKDDVHPAVLIVGERAGGALAAATVDERWLVGIDEADQLPADANVCLATGRQPICSFEVAPQEIATAFASTDHGEVRLESGQGPQLAWISTVSLDAHYDAKPWHVAVLRPISSIRAPIFRFVQDFLLVVIVTSLVVAWLSVRQVRRHLDPLWALTAATGRLTRHDFEQPVDVRSGDEFETLGNAFNDMAAKLRQQFADLESFNIGTLTTLARAIDAKSPWTAGHSERVTAMAVDIGKAIGLPAKQIDELRRGGLVHDIGKIATPAEILDKPDRLTPEETRVMQLHPEQGVHILEPIAAFRSVLPIVGQHHERWDGSGYPKGLSHTDIARTARVLAVADVYDALRSDRPYRSGMPHQKVVGIIRDGAGTHFDPEVVAAFLAIESSLDRAASAMAVAMPSSRPVRAAG
jgi:putative nucleotidyltransferase with HDIG domain